MSIPLKKVSFYVNKGVSILHSIFKKTSYKIITIYNSIYDIRKYEKLFPSY